MGCPAQVLLLWSSCDVELEVLPFHLSEREPGSRWVEVTGTGEDGIMGFGWNSEKNSQCSPTGPRGWLRLPGDTRSDWRLGIKRTWHLTTATV